MSNRYNTMSDSADGAQYLSTADTPTILSPRPQRPPSTLLVAPLEMSPVADPDEPEEREAPAAQQSGSESNPLHVSQDRVRARDWNALLAVRFADYIAYATRRYGAPMPAPFTVVYGPTPASADKAAWGNKTRDYSVVTRGRLGQLREDIVRLCIVKCVKALGAPRAVLFSIRVGFPPVGDGDTPRSTALVPRRLWDANVWDAAVLGDELANESVWGDAAWETVCGLNGSGRGKEYEIQAVRV
ncbi:hypothetical protein F5Y14DRAFT_427014 [Nemania sp. NC0429]|nr:hypothetical protein F5Y14DRAFT_427014 [Nemania sp. NC0429]